MKTETEAGGLIANLASELGNFLVFVQCLTLSIIN